MYDEQLKKELRSINARITTVQRIYGKDSSIFRRIIDTIQKAGGNTRFSRKMFEGNLRQLNKAYNALETIKSSAYLTKEGRKRIGEEARRTFGIKHKKYSDTTLSKVFDIFQNSSFSRFDEVYKGSSETFIDAIMSAFEEDENNELTVGIMSEKIDYFLSHLDEFDKGNKSKDIGIALERFNRWLSI